MRFVLVGIVLAACSRGHRTPIELTPEMRAKLTSIAPTCERTDTTEACRGDHVEAYLMLRDGKLWGLTYIFAEPRDAAAAHLRAGLTGVIDDELVTGLVDKLEPGTDWIYRDDVRGMVHRVTPTNGYVIEIRWTYR